MCPDSCIFILSMLSLGISYFPLKKALCCPKRLVYLYCYCIVIVCEKKKHQRSFTGMNTKPHLFPYFQFKRILNPIFRRNAH